MTLRDYEKQKTKVGEVLVLGKDDTGRTTASVPTKTPSKPHKPVVDTGHGVLTVDQLQVGDQVRLVDRRANGLGQGTAVVVGIFQPLPGVRNGETLAVLLGMEDQGWSAAYFDAELKRCQATVITSKG